MSNERKAETSHPSPSGAGKPALDGGGGPLSALKILDEAQAVRVVLQDYQPLAESLDWELGQSYFKERGSLAFIGDPELVPFLVNNDGNLSVKAAEVVFTSLVEAEKAGALEEDLFVLEIGIGVGLFARFFLDWFEHLCDQHSKDYYDGSATWQQTCRRGCSGMPAGTGSSTTTRDATGCGWPTPSAPRRPCSTTPTSPGRSPGPSAPCS